MTVLDKVKAALGGARKTTGNLAEKAEEAAKDTFEKVEDVAEKAADRIRGEEDSADEVTPSVPPA